MFDRKKTSATAIQEQIDVVLSNMSVYHPDSDEYLQHLSVLERLMNLKTQEKGKPVSKDVLIGVAANIAGIGMIIGYERVHVIASKALGLVVKTKV